MDHTASENFSVGSGIAGGVNYDFLLCCFYGILRCVHNSGLCKGKSEKQSNEIESCSKQFVYRGRCVGSGYDLPWITDQSAHLLLEFPQTVIPK